MLPISPNKHLQELTRHDPWLMLMTCMMLNQTHFKQVLKIHDEFFSRWPDAKALLEANDPEIIELIRPLGFYNRRCKQWKRFCTAWLQAISVYENPQAIPVIVLQRMPGIGKYALDSWKMFQLCEYDIPVEDKVLKIYKAWALQQVAEINLL